MVAPFPELVPRAMGCSQTLAARAAWVRWILRWSKYRQRRYSPFGCGRDASPGVPSRGAWEVDTRCAFIIPMLLAPAPAPLVPGWQCLAVAGQPAIRVFGGAWNDNKAPLTKIIQPGVPPDRLIMGRMLVRLATFLIFFVPFRPLQASPRRRKVSPPGAMRFRPGADWEMIVTHRCL